MTSSYSSLLDILLFRASSASALRNKDVYVFLADGENVTGTLTFATLDARARRIAAGLQQRCKPQDRVVLALAHDLDYVLAFMGCVYAGLIAVPALPPRNAAAAKRLELVIDDCAATLVLGKHDRAAPDVRCHFASLEDMEQPADQWAPPVLIPSDICFLQYTSGSTGAPKGVMVSHENIIANLQLCQRVYDLSEHDILLAWLPPHHDFGLIGSILLPVFLGSQSIQFPAPVFLRRPYLWLKLMSDYGATMTGAPNFAYELCVRRIDDEQKRSLDLSALRLAVNGAERIRHATLADFARAFSSCGFAAEALTPAYGLAESTLLVSASRLSRPSGLPLAQAISRRALAAGHASPAEDSADEVNLVAVGHADNFGHGVCIVDPATNLPLPDGAVGEIWIHGPSVTRGYWGKTEQSGEQFNVRPGDEGPACLRSGDLGFVLENRLYVSGRLKELIIINGRNIYPQDIETAIEQLDPRFRTDGCAAFGVETDQGTGLVIVQEVGPGFRQPDTELAARIQASLAAQFDIFRLEALYFVRGGGLPRTTSGKIQRGQCRAMHLADAIDCIWKWPSDPVSSAATGHAPATRPGLAPIEARLIAIGRELLDGQRTWSTSDNFLDGGAHSLFAQQFLEIVRNEYGVELDLKFFFEAPTIAQIAERIYHAVPAPQTPAGPVPVPAEARHALPLSFAQQRLWFLDQLSEGAGSAYHLPAALRLHGALDLPALKTALDRIVARHEILRTTFASKAGRPMQVIAPEGGEFSLTRCDLRDVGPQAQQARIDELRNEEATRPFDLAAGPLIRGQLLVLAEQEHVLLVTLHHIVSDGWSIGVLLDELRTLYKAFHQGLPDPLAPLPLQFADYAVWQRHCLEGPAHQEHADFWKTYLDGASPLLTLPLDRVRPPVQSYKGNRVAVTLGAPLAARLRDFAQRHGVTLFMTLLAGWSIVLARLSGQTDLVIGTPVASRQRGHVESLIGFFANTLALRIRMHDDPSVAQFLAHIKDSALRAMAHQEMPFDQVVELLQPVRSLSHNALFQAMLALDNTPLDKELALPGLRLDVLEPVNTAAQFDLLLSLTDQGGGEVTGSLQYASDLFDASSVARMAGYFERVLGAMLDNDTQQVSRIDLLSDEQRAHLLFGLNASDTAYPSGHLIHQLFEARAAAQPDAVALVFEERTMSYGELNRKANRLAHRLIKLGVQPDDRVAICAERGMDMVIGLLGILKAGGAYVPLDPAYPQERLAFMLEDCAPVAILSHGHVLDALPALAMPVIDLDDGLDREDEGNPVVPDLTSSHLAYVIYTSGSTGMPKGVMNQHDGVVNRLHWAQEKFGLDGRDRVLQKTPFGFDVSVWEFFLTLGAGATLVIAPPGAHQEPETIAGLVERHGVTMLHFVPSMLQAFVAHNQAASLAKVQHIICSGEALPYALRAQVHAELPQVRLHNLYGPTEAAVDVSCWTCEPDKHVGITPIGKPVANTRLYLLDAHQQPVPLGVVGEIYIGGVQVARGYLNRPELTAERFVVDPFSTTPDARMYRTGDLGRLLDDGNIEYLGRNDFQVKLRGLRIELGEIEARLLECEGVREAVVVAREDAPGDKRLVAYLVPNEGAVLSTADLRTQLSAVLSEYMVPSAFVMLEALPLTSNGKVDRKALPAPDQSALISRVYEAPQGELETAIAGIWQDLLGVSAVGRHDHFFELGGHSLLAVQFISRVRQMLGVEVTLRELFAQPSLSGFAGTVARARRADEPPMIPADRSHALPLSWAQQRLWFLDQLDHAAGAAYHMPAALRLSGELDRAALMATLDRIVARHENLRTTFVQVDGQPVQRIAAPDCGFALTLHDLHGLGEDQQHEQVRALTAAEAASPFDLTTGPLIRGRLIQLSDREHILLVTQHHIISDGWSIGVLIREVGALYSAFSQGHADPLPPLALQYADYAAWQRQWLQGDVLDRQLDFWRTHLNGAPELLTLPTDRARPATQSYRGASVNFRLSTELSTALGGLAQRHGCTLFMTLFAGWAVLMARLSGQDDVVIGTPVANRQRLEIEALIGFFVNSLAVRVRLDDDPGVGALLERVRATMLDAYTHQDVPFEQVVEAVQPMRSLSHGPLFQTMFTLNSASANGALNLPGLNVAPVEVEHGTTHFDLSLSLTDTGAGITGTIDYASDLFDAGTVTRMAGYFERLLAAMVADDAQQVSRIALMSDAQRDELLVQFNATDAAYRTEQLIHQLFETQAASQPDTVALVFGGRTMSYGELNRKANQLAHALIGRGVKPDDRIAISVERSMSTVIGLLGILKSGGAYVPLDPGYPRERLAHMLEDCAPAAVLTQGHLHEHLPALAVPVLDLDEDFGQYDERNPDPAVLGLGASNLAYVIYTSGSTGMPKGVMVEHRGIPNLALSQSEAFAVDKDSRVLQFASMSFDASVSEVAMALCSGASLVIASQDDLFPGPPLLDTLRVQRITHVTLPPAALPSCGSPDQLADTITVICAGEALPAAVANEWGRRHRLFNAYGPTESTVCASLYACQENRNATVPIGRPMANTRLYVLDSYSQPVPLGVAGEVYIGGIGVARGYLNRPELTAERFVADPFSDRPGARMYKTGDLGRWLDDGNIEYLGRNDSQVKLRGFRIEPGEIEAQLLECEGVREAVVLAREDVPGDKRLVAYVVPHAGVTLSVAELRMRLSTVLAEYMVPSAFVTLEALPLTPNGKVDRKLLPAPDQSALASRVYEAPQGELETAVAGIWQQLLGVEMVGRHDQFFELGGHSLLAVQFISRVRQMLGVEVTLRELFAQPSLSGFAGTVARARRADEPPMMPTDRSQALPLSWAQQRLWFLDQLDHAAGAAYHMPAALRLSGALDREALQATLNRIVARHENLRTTFVQVDGQPVQRIAESDCGFALTLHDLQGLGQEQQHAQVRTLAAAEAAGPFDLATGPLIRGQLIQLSDREHILLVTQHHIISDGWSIGVLIREVGALYSAFSQGHADPLPPLALQYADYAAWQRQWLQGDVLDRQVDFWRGHLNGAPELLTLPTDRPRPATQSYRGASVNFRLPAELSTALGGLAQRHGCTLFMTLFTGWAVLMARLSGQDDVVIGTPVANRQRLEIESLIGFFVNSLAVRVRLDDDPGVGTLLERVRSTMLDAYTHQDVPFEQVVEAVQPVRSLSHSPLFQTMFTLNSPSANLALMLPGLNAEQVAVEHGTTHFDLSLSLTDTGAGITGTIDYASDLFDADTVARMAGYFERLLAAMAADEAQQVSRIGLLSAEQRDQLVVEFNATGAAYPSEQLIHQLFEAQAQAHPEATALVFEERTMSYGELNRKANQVAHRLIKLGVTADDRVAICAERGIELIVGLLGILKAGGAYVPLDPAYPRERLAFMLEDCSPVAVLSQGRSLDALPALAIPVIDLDARLDQENESNPAVPDLTSAHLAYVIYTSGSTGLPKGVMVEHRSVVNLWRALDLKIFADLPRHSKFALNASMTFDSSVKSFIQLLSGHCLYILPHETRFDETALLEFLDQYDINVVDCTPVQLKFFTAETVAAGRLSRLRHVLVGGDAISLAQWEKLSSICPTRFHNLYGPTECTVDASVANVDGRLSRPHIGSPIANASIYILDRHLQPVPLGAVGEIYIGGAGVARGYLNRPELTAERFMGAPFSATPGARMYKTGDLGRWLDDGNIEFIGRTDFQVKLRGFRIELGEIEARLQECEGVREAVVLAREDAPGVKRLVAYLVPHAGVTLSVAELRMRLSTVLAEYMVPSAFVTLEAMPLTPNGKVDRKALPVPDQSALVSRAYEAPQGELETAIAGIWQDLLGVSAVGRHDHFFELGGHSLQVITLIEQLRKHGYRADVKTIFLAPTVAGLAAAMGAEHRAGDEFAVPPNLIATNATAITPEMLPLVTLTQAEIDGIAAAVEGGVANIQDMYPLSPLQQGILFHHMLNEQGGDTYLLRSVLAFDLRERLDGFLDALQTVIDRHDILRSAFHWEGLAQPVQVVQRQAKLPIVEVAPSDDRDALAQLMDATNPRHVALDLRKAPLLAAYIAQDGESGEWLLALLNHHLICDHIALEIVVAEVHRILQGQSNTLGTPLPYRNFIAQIQSLPMAGHEAYFRTLLGDVDEPTAPFGVLDVQGAGDTIVETRALLDDDLAGRIRGAARAQGVTPAVLCHLAWAQVLAQCCNRSDVVFGSVLSGRLQGTQDAGRIMGMFVNTLPVRVTLDGVSVRQAVQDTYRQLSELLVHEQAPLALAQRCSAVVAPMPLFTSVLNYRHSKGILTADSQSHPHWEWDGIRPLSAEERTNYPITMTIDDLGQKFALAIQCAGDVDGERLSAYFEQAISALTDALGQDSQQPVNTISVLPAAERHRLLVEFNATHVEYTSAQLVHQLFEAHAHIEPEALALVFDDERVSYGELNKRANQLAHYLIGLGVKPDDRVAICVERSIDMMVGILGILKSGGAYVPLEPTYPVERLAYMLEDCAPVALLIQSHLRGSLPAVAMPIIDLDEKELCARQNSGNPDPAALGLMSSNLAYVIYTSGSTGRPKGVMNQHDGVVNGLNWAQQKFVLDGRDRVLQKAPFGFDVSVWEFFQALGAGATLVIAPPGAHREPAVIADLVERHGVTLLHFVPSVLQAFMAHTDATSLRKVRHIICIGEALAYALRSQMHAELPQVRLHNVYGPTEASVVISCWTCEPDAHVGITPIGKPFANTRLYLLDAQQQPVPLGVPGELYIGGVQVARGYINRPELTAERFVADPFSDEPDARMYRTGDLARWLDDGNIEYLGRNDFQVKIRGLRIELGEIEARLLACDGVRQTVVLAREDVPGDKRLVAYLVPRAGAVLSAAGLREQLLAVLAEYMVPSAFVTLEAMPLTPNGKVDRKALPAPDLSALVGRAYEAPRGEVETAIAQIWADLLGVNTIGRHHPFFELGGNSLTAIQMLAKIRAKYGSEISIAEFFKNPTIVYLGEKLERKSEPHIARRLALELELRKKIDNMSHAEILSLLKERTNASAKASSEHENV